MRCSRCDFLDLFGTTKIEQHGVMFLIALRCLRHSLFTYVSYKRFYALHCALFGRSVLMLFSLNFSHSEMVFITFYERFVFQSGTRCHRARRRV